MSSASGTREGARVRVGGNVYSFPDIESDGNIIISSGDQTIEGTISGATIRNSGATTIFKPQAPEVTTLRSRTVTNLADIKSNSSAQAGAVVFTAPATTTNIMFLMEVSGMLYNNNIIRFAVQAYRTSNTWGQFRKVNFGTGDVDVRWGIAPGGESCLILGDTTSTWSYPHFHVLKAMFSYTGFTSDAVADAYSSNWTSAFVTSLTGYTNISTIVPNNPMSTNANTATTLQTTRTIWGQNFNGSANVTGNLTAVGSITGTAAVTIAAGGTNQNITLTPTGTGTVNAPTFNATSTTNGGFQGIATDTAALPSHTWTGDLTTGMYRPGTGIVGFTTAGAERVRITSGATTILGNLVLGTQTNKATITYPTNTARTYSLPDAGANADFVMTAGEQTVGGTKTLSSQLVSTAANNTANGGGQIYLNGTTGNRIEMNTNGVANPTNTTRSLGTKIVLFPGVSASDVDYALGIASSTLWFSVPNSARFFRWFGGTTEVGTLSGSGALTTTGTVTAPTFNATSATDGGFQGIATDTAALPSHTWTGDLDTGMYRAGADIVGFTAGGTERGRIATNGMTLAVPLLTSQTSTSVFNTTATTITAFGAATAMTLGGTPTSNVTHNYSTNATAIGSTKTLNIGTGGVAGSTTNVNIAPTDSTGLTTIGNSLNVRGRLQTSSNTSSVSWTTNGISFDSSAATFTDTSSAEGATVASRTANSFNRPTFASTNAITLTNASTVYIAAAPLAATNTTITNTHAVDIASGRVYLRGAGSATIPALAIRNVDTGLFSSANGVINVTSQGTLRLSVGGTTTTLAGNLVVSGSVTKGSGTFKIDHPLKPDSHHLVHSFIEGPNADLLYRGKAELVEGAASINIDEAARMTEGTFVALCRNTQCFVSNESDWDAVRARVVGNRIFIECMNPSSTATVSWLVIGERQDKHMMDIDWTDEMGRVIVEPEKIAEPEPDQSEEQEEEDN
jgi:hypothetical protein